MAADAPTPTVMHVIPGLGSGGAEGMLAALVTAKRTEPLSQVVVNLVPEGVNAGRIRAAGVPLHNLGLTNPAMGGRILYELTGLIRRYRPAAIQSWLYLGDLTALWALHLAGRRKATRLYWGVRGSYLNLSDYNFNLRMVMKLCNWQSRAPDAVIANSFAGRDDHLRMGYRPRAFGVIPNGIDISRFRLDADARARIRTELGIIEGRPMVIHAARNDPMKDHDTLFAVATQLPNVTFVLAGVDTEKLRGPGNVISLGTRRDMPALFAAADAAVLTSIYGEGFPNVIAEAMACGTPVVATDCGDARRIVGSTGTITAPRDISAFTAALRTILDEPAEQRRRRAETCRIRIKDHFSLERTVEAFDALHRHGTLPAD